MKLNLRQGIMSIGTEDLQTKMLILAEAKSASQTYMYKAESSRIYGRQNS